MSHIFISCSKKDTRKLALKLNDALNALAGVTCWVDKSLRAGRSWELQIEKEIDRCDVMVVLYSEDIHRHKRGEEESYVLTEIAYAKRYAKKLIIPVMAQATQPPMSMINEYYIDYTGLGLSMADLVAGICYEAGIDGASTSQQSQVKPPPKPVGTPYMASEKLMPSPFAWIDIPGGRVTLVTEKGWAANYILEGQSQTFNVPAFAIAKYPITNAQFAKFIEAGGYNTQTWWTDAGWQQRQKDGWTEPRYWGDKKWNGAEQPVVGVSWYEAVAFSLWLSEASGEAIMLPTEQQWQRAAQGDKGYTYPWGNDWDRSRCNNNVDKKAIGKTTPVTHYEGKGDSPYGVVDMSGNVWEWCLTEYESGSQALDGTNRRVLRGGSWGDAGTEGFRAAFRFWFDPGCWFLYDGFRVSRS